jgi:translocation and assembly module TamA
MSRCERAARRVRAPAWANGALLDAGPHAGGLLSGLLHWGLCLALALAAVEARAEGDAGVPAAAAAQTSVQAAYRLDIDAPEELRKLLLAYLDLARFQNVGDTESITGPELDRLIAAAPAQARALLETEGYFAATVTAQRAPGAGPVPLVQLKVTPGRRVTVTRWTLDALGELQLLIEANDELARTTFDTLRRDWPLPTGAPFRQPAWSAAKTQTLARLRANGYPSANWLDTDAAVDVAQSSATLRATLASGPLFRLGELRIEGLSRYDASSVRNVAEFGVGAPHSEQRLLDLQERLVKTGLFEGVSVEVDPDPAQASAAPVLVRLRELPLQQATVGVGYSDNTGQRITFEHMHRRPFGFNVIAKNKVEFGRDARSWSGELTSHTLPGLYRNLLAGSYEKLEVADEIRTSWRWRVGRAYDSQRIERVVFGEWLGSELRNIAGREQADALSLNFSGAWRRLDSVILPTEGLTASGLVGGGWSQSSVADSGLFSRVSARVTVYEPLGLSWYGTGRVEAGHVNAGGSTGLPDPLLFRAGGDDSVRGYGYRTLGPLKAGVVSSGRALLTASAEIARPINARMPSLWWAAFVDAGNAAEHFNTLDPAVGYGLGLRWRSPVGPLRIDWAYGVEVRKARLHLSVGIAL